MARVEKHRRERASLDWIRRGDLIKFKGGRRPPRFNHGISMKDATPSQLDFMALELPRFERIGAWERGHINRWVSRMFLVVPKPGTNKWRLIVDGQWEPTHVGERLGLEMDLMRGEFRAAAENLATPARMASGFLATCSAGTAVIGTTALDLLTGSLAPRIYNNYGSGMRTFAAFCNKEDNRSLDATPGTIIRYTAWLGLRGTVAAESLQQYFSALNKYFREHQRQPVVLGELLAWQSSSHTAATYYIILSQLRQAGGN
eukprot:jgi/Tetstr1/453584/TSEL_003979.t1